MKKDKKKKSKIIGLREKDLKQMEDYFRRIEVKFQNTDDEVERARLVNIINDYGPFLKEARAQIDAKLDRREKKVKIVKMIVQPVFVAGVYAGMHIITQMWESNGGYYSSKMAKTWAEKLCPKLDE